MNKILKSYTIIPDELYVRRDADRQLEESLNDMGRPPYVLVARQMGKTNLLLNAKRKLPREGDLFVYIDMSNPFTISRDCFRNIIDRIIETNDILHNNVSEKVLKNRELNLPAHAEHGKELRICLKAITGKLVIILDEIDALTKSTFSDEIFSQIRSIYFERVNFVEFERLTYVLSGVAEPNEIIKNPKISPFNIGQKLFLNDFSYEEFNAFIHKASLSIPSEIEEYIFEWTKGNPRMTWDMCSALEERIISQNDITKDTIDSIVGELYLTYFDRAPVDHIRDLVANDIAIRNAIIEIKYDKGDTLSDAIRRKLYLSGIISSISLDGNAVIKNKIIDRALSLKWLNDINDQTKDYYSQGNAAFEESNFYDAYINYNQYLSKAPKETPPIFNFRFALCCFRLNKYEDALKYFDLFEFSRKEFEDNYLLTINIKGLCYAYLGKNEEARKCFSEVVTADRKNYLYFDAKTNLISFDAITKNADDLSYVRSDAIDTLEKIDFFKENYTEDQHTELEFTLRIILGIIERKLQNDKDALISYRQALAIAPIYVQPEILYNILEFEPEKDVKTIVDLIIKNQLKPHQFDPIEPYKFTTAILYKIAVMTFKRSKHYFKKLSNYIINDLNANESDYSLKYHLALYINKFLVKDKFVATQLLNEVYQERDEIDDEVFNFKVLKSLALSYVKPSAYDTTYFNVVRTKKHIIQFDEIDMQIFAKNILSLNENKLSRRAIELADLGLHYSEKEHPNGHIFNVLFYYYKILAYRTLNNKLEISRWANKVLETINLKANSTNPNFIDGVIGERELNLIKQEALNASNNSQIGTVINKRKFSRNDVITVVYNDESQRTGKYKSFEADIANGRCRIL